MSSRAAPCCCPNPKVLYGTQRVCLEQKGALAPDYVEDKGEKGSGGKDPWSGAEDSQEIMTRGFRYFIPQLVFLNE